MATNPNRGPDDPYARGSFTFRRMARWQIVAMSAVLVVLLILIVMALF